MPPKKKTELEEGATPEPSVIDPAVIELLGTRKHEFIVVEPVKVGTAGMSDVVTIRQTSKFVDLPQPYLTLEDARKLGKQEWCKRPDGLYSTIVQGRRFIITEAILKELS